LEARAGGQFSLLGNSLGGAVALRLALLRPELVRCLVLAAPAGFSPRAWSVATAAGSVIEPLITFRRILGAPLAGSATARRALLWGAVAEPQRLPADEARAMLRGSRGSRRIGPAVAAVLQADLRAGLGRLDVPLGVIWGRLDRVVPISAIDSIRAVRPDVLVETIPRAAHVPQIERPSQFVAALRRILDRLS
jgi:pimeloyl-ACP methyl ester carboxylesterase